MKPASEDQKALAGLAATLLDMALVAVLAFGAMDRWAPPQDLFWKPLSLDRPLGLAIRSQLAKASGDPALCRRTLAESGVRFSEAPDRRSGYCVIENAVRLTGGITPLSPAAPTMTCPLALSYALWDRQVLRPAAASLGAEPHAVEHYGTYACRNVYGRDDARPSEHAEANALDVAAIRLSDRRVTVLGDFQDEDDGGAFLRRARDGACKLFGATLGPDYNAAHRDHLHLDRGRYRVCS